MFENVLKGKTAVVTGSNSGIGLGIARAMAAAGANVVINSFTDDAADHKLAADMAAAAHQLGVVQRFECVARGGDRACGPRPGGISVRDDRHAIL